MKSRWGHGEQEHLAKNGQNAREHVYDGVSGASLVLNVVIKPEQLREVVVLFWGLDNLCHEFPKALMVCHNGERPP